MKCFKTISQRVYCPNLAEHLCAYITGGHKCQLFKKGRNFDRPYQKRINLNVPTMTKINMDIKEMPLNHGYTHNLVLLCEVSNFLVAPLLHSTRTQHFIEIFREVSSLLWYNLTYYLLFGPSFYFLSYGSFLKHLDIKMLTVSVTNHKSLLAEHWIKRLSTLLVRHLPEIWPWSYCLSHAMCMLQLL